MAYSKWNSDKIKMIDHIYEELQKNPIKKHITKEHIAKALSDFEGLITSKSKVKYFPYLFKIKKIGTIYRPGYKRKKTSLQSEKLKKLLKLNFNDLFD